MKVVLYLRASTTKQIQDGYSISYQKDKLVAYAKLKDWEIINEYIDAGESGRTTNRPAFKKMVEDAKNNKFESVLVYKLDRFSRSLQDLLTVINIMKENGVFVWSVTQSYDDRTPEGRLMRNMLGSFSQFESEMIGARVKDGMARRAKDGDWNTAPPYGFRLEEKLIPIENEVNIVRKVYTEYNSGKTMNEISKELNEKKVPTKRNGKWNPNTVRRILTNPIYVGKMNYRDELIQTKLKPIISKAIFQLTSKIRSEKNRKTNNS